MKLSCVALSISAVALTASAASVPASPQSPRIAMRFGQKSKFLSPDQREKSSTRVHAARSTVGEGQPGNHLPTTRPPLLFMMKRAKNFEKKTPEASKDFNKRPLPSTEVPCEPEATTSAPLRSTPQPQQTPTPLPPTGTIAKSGIPGFMEVEIPDSTSGLAPTVSRLAYSTTPAASGAGFDLGTSPSDSTQFLMSAINAEDGASLYRLSVPILDSATSETIDHCATFAISPPGPLSLQKCGPLIGFSQSFSYDSTSGELQPVYTPSGKGFLSGSRWNVLPLARDSDRSAEFSPADATSRAVPVVASKSEAPVESNTSTKSTSSPVLYFAPAASFQDPSFDTPETPKSSALNTRLANDNNSER